VKRKPKQYLPIAVGAALVLLLVIGAVLLIRMVMADK